MPYLKKEQKEGLADLVYFFDQIEFDGPGDLNYLVTELCLCYINRGKGARYRSYNDVVGALESAKLEFYRRAVAPYEDKAIAMNGDVYNVDDTGDPTSESN